MDTAKDFSLRFHAVADDTAVAMRANRRQRMIIIGAGASISALARGPAMLFIGQLLVGTGVGIDFPSVAAMSQKFCPSAVVRE